MAFVTLSPPADAGPWFTRYGLADVLRVSDPSAALYRQFGLGDGTLTTLAHPRVWWPWARTAIVRGRGAGAPGRHWRQLTGAFVLHRGQVLAAIRHRDSAESIDYVAFVQGLNPDAPVR